MSEGGCTCIEESAVSKRGMASPERAIAVTFFERGIMIIDMRRWGCG